MLPKTFQMTPSLQKLQRDFQKLQNIPSSSSGDMTPGLLPYLPPNQKTRSTFPLPLHTHAYAECME
jgi:hypothetical protein